MKKSIKIVILTIIIIAVAVILNPNARHNIERYVKNNSDELAEISEDLLEQNVSVHLKYRNWDVNCFATTDTPVVQFTVSGFGVAPSGYYKGFYYSAEDVPLGFQGIYTEMIPDGDRWLYHYEGDNQGFTEKIADKWYWFEMNF